MSGLAAWIGRHGRSADRGEARAMAAAAPTRGFVDEQVLRTTYSGYLTARTPVPEREWRVFWRFPDVEDWLRRVHDR